MHDNRVVVGGHARDKAGGKTKNADQTIAIDRATVAALRAWRGVQDRDRRVLWQRLSFRRLRVHLRGRSPTSPGHHPAAFRPPRRGRGALADHLPRCCGTLYATGALKAGVSAKVVSDRIGHANVGFFLQTYAHVLGNDDREAAEQAASFLIGDGWDLVEEGAAEDDETV